ncbi:hypothetical protein IW261DRAFT_1611350 [Armillaria novae-zelandiae]|uniref:Uncharacterized protein n=1 Tax=Armillaria novae-zelandiae TaxID=153914 RepID=A0AA39NX09_9AGAR|nr:hypothetical protein IW261DRAFT_1611350 [Armillaria novae-zelandiae]
MSVWCAYTTATPHLLDKRGWMFLYFFLFGFCFSTSAGFMFYAITENATVGTPFPLTWYLDKGDVPDKLQLQERLISQDLGDGQIVPISFPNNGTLSGTLSVTFAVPGDHFVEAFEDDPKSPIASSDVIDVSIAFASSSFITADASSSASTISTPSSTPNNSNSHHEAKQISTIIGAVVGVVVFLLLLALGVVCYRRLHRHRRHMPLPCLTAILPYLQIRPSSQHGAIHKLEGRHVSVPASVEVPKPMSINSMLVDFDVEEGVLGANQPMKPFELVATRPLSLVADDSSLGLDPGPSHSESIHQRESLQIPDEEPTLHANTLTPRARNAEMAEEIVRLRTQIHQLIVDRVSGWDQDREIDPPPAYVREV